MSRNTQLSYCSGRNGPKADDDDDDDGGGGGGS
jgi:hypothetical protein